MLYKTQKLASKEGIFEILDRVQLRRILTNVEYLMSAKFSLFMLAEKLKYVFLILT